MSSSSCASTATSSTRSRMRSSSTRRSTRPTHTQRRGSRLPLGKSRSRRRRVMAYDAELAARIRDLIAGEAGLGEKKMFGGLAFLIGGNMAGGARGQSGGGGGGGPAGAGARVGSAHPRAGGGGGRGGQGWGGG